MYFVYYFNIQMQIYINKLYFIFYRCIYTENIHKLYIHLLNVHFSKLINKVRTKKTKIGGLKKSGFFFQYGI